MKKHEYNKTVSVSDWEEELAQLKYEFAMSAILKSISMIMSIAAIIISILAMQQ